MRCILQRVREASVEVEGEIVGQINLGYLLMVRFEHEDNQEDIEWLAAKISRLRMFLDEDGKKNKDLMEVDGEVLVVSQFTLHAKYKKGNRPSFARSARPEIAIHLYEDFISEMGKVTGKKIETGKFGAMMNIRLENYGPVMLILDTKNKE